VLGKRGVFQTSGNGSRNCGLKPDALWIEQIQGKAPNFTGDISDVFSCMAQLGVKGCGYEHQLQALRVALSTETTPKHRGFLRDNAYLAIVIISDEDDCSAEPGSDMFDQPLENEMASLRCATRGHTCGGQALPFPTTGEFSANLADCKAKDSANKNELPLIRVQEFVDYVRNVKPRPDEQIVVAGIFGWPLDRENLLDPKGQPTRYRIGKDATAAAELRGLWDYLPVCEVPGLGKSYAGLRLKAFVDAFGDNGQSFSLCSGDFTESMQKIGEKLRLKLENSCVAYKLIDKDADRAGLQPECQVFDSIPDGRKYRDVQIPACANNPNARPCWQLAEDFKTCPNLGQKIDVLRTEKPPSGTKLVMKCLTCALPDGNCPAE
jgi:hypothetical protein